MTDPTPQQPSIADPLPPITHGTWSPQVQSEFAARESSTSAWPLSIMLFVASLLVALFLVISPASPELPEHDNKITIRDATTYEIAHATWNAELYAQELTKFQVEAAAERARRHDLGLAALLVLVGASQLLIVWRLRTRPATPNR